VYLLVTRYETGVQIAFVINYYQEIMRSGILSVPTKSHNFCFPYDSRTSVYAH